MWLATRLPTRYWTGLYTRLGTTLCIGRNEAPQAVFSFFEMIWEGIKMLINSNEYLDIVKTIKQEIQQAQYKATLSVNKELIMLYHNIGNS